MVEQVAPELVEKDAEGYKHVAYSRATALLTVAVKEMRESFESDMKAVLEELKATRDELRELQRQIKA